MKIIKIGTCQTPEIIGDIDTAIQYILDVSNKSESKDLDLLLFPECFLQGYVINKDHLNQYGISTNSQAFSHILKSLKNISQVVVLGFIEEDHGKYYNSAMVVNRGILKGIYRKHHLLAGEKLFQPGEGYPIFELNEIKYGINICYDTQFTDVIKKLNKLGARILLVPAQNMMKIQSAEKWKNLHSEIRIQRAKEANMWLISSDVTGKRGETHISYGPTAIIAPNGEVISQVPTMQIGMVTATISFD